MGQYAVIGLGRFGESVARSLMAMGHEVLAIDISEEKIQEIADFVTEAVRADAKNEEFLRSMDMAGFDAVVVSMAQDIEANILVTMQLKGLGAKYIVAKAQSQLHGEVLERIGADKIIHPEWDMGERIAHLLASSRSIMDYIELSPHYSIFEFLSPQGFHGQSLGQLDLRAKYSISVLAVKRGEEIFIAPGGDFTFYEGDIIIAIGPKDIEGTLSQIGGSRRVKFTFGL